MINEDRRQKKKLDHAHLSALPVLIEALKAVTRDKPITRMDAQRILREWDAAREVRDEEPNIDTPP